MIPLLWITTFLLLVDHLLTSEPSFVLPVDEGLSYASIYPFADEWKRTFAAVIPEDRHLELPLPVHFWFRCVDGIARIYFSLEDTHSKPTFNQPQGTEVRGNLLHILQSTIKLKLDSVETRYNVWNGGADVQFDVRKKPYRSVLRVQINDWTPYTAFPVNQCVRSSRQPQGSHWSMNTAPATSSFWFNHSMSSSETVQSVLGLSSVVVVPALLTPSKQAFPLSLTHSQSNTISSSSSNGNQNNKEQIQLSSSTGSTGSSGHIDIVVHVHTFDQFFKGRHPRMQVCGCCYSVIITLITGVVGLLPLHHHNHRHNLIVQLICTAL